MAIVFSMTELNPRRVNAKMRDNQKPIVLLIHDNAQPHESARISNELHEIFGQPPYSPDFAPSDYHHLFRKRKEFLG